MMITVSVFLILSIMIFDLMSGTLQGAAALQDNQIRSDQLSALYAFVKNKLTMMPARSSIASYSRGDGEGLIQNGIIFGNTNLATAIDGKLQPDSLYLIRLTSYATDASAQEAQDARQVLMQSVTTDDPTLVWTPLIKDVKTLEWKFQDAALVQWDTTWTNNATPNLIEFTLQAPGDTQTTTMDFWVPKINPVNVQIQANTGAGGGGGGPTPRPRGPTRPPRRRKGERAEGGGEGGRMKVEGRSAEGRGATGGGATASKIFATGGGKGRRKKVEGRSTGCDSTFSGLRGKGRRMKDEGRRWAPSSFALHPSPLRSRRGSALLIVLWALILLGMAVFGVVEIVELSIDHASHEQRALEARGLALSGLALGLHPQLMKDDPILAQAPAPNQQWKASFSSEGARLNLNYVLLSKHKEILVNLFTQWGLGVDQAGHVADCLYDWVTPGDLKSLDGAKAQDYANANLPQRPTYAPFDSLDEVALVMDFDLVEKARPNWQDSFTLWSSGPLNVNEAPAELIAAVFSIDPQRVAFFTSARNGRDGIAGTSDDVPVKSLTALAGQLGLSTLQQQTLGNQVEFSDANRRVDSLGTAQGAEVKISVVTRLNSSPIQYLLWSEQ
jgi:type II secretory pathway component PulK